MSDFERNSPWICHVCDKKSDQTEGQACSECFKIACSQHLHIASRLNQDSGLYELKQVCVECQLRSQL